MSNHSFKSKFPSSKEPIGISPPILHVSSEVSKDFIVSIPLSPEISRFQLFFWPKPSGETIPIPVTTTRLLNILGYAASIKSIASFIV